MTNPTPERSERAKTAEEISKELASLINTGNGSCDDILEALESYADSVAERYAEERVKDILAGNEDFVQRSDAVLKIAVYEAFKAGQERMRERAALALESMDYRMMFTAKVRAIRSLEVEEK